RRGPDSSSRWWRAVRWRASRVSVVAVFFLVLLLIGPGHAHQGFDGGSDPGDESDDGQPWARLQLAVEPMPAEVADGDRHGHFDSDGAGRAGDPPKFFRLGVDSRPFRYHAPACKSRSTSG